MPIEGIPGVPITRIPSNEVDVIPYTVANTRASISDLRTQLGTYLAAVKAGGEILVTERGHPIAMITPIVRRNVGEERPEGLMRSGLVRERSVPLTDEFFLLPRPADSESNGVRAILAERAEGR